MEFSFGPIRSLHVRTNESTASDGGVYLHAEVAIVDSVADKDYTSALGVAMRRDEMSTKAKKQRDELIEAARKGTIELERVRLEQSVAAVASTPAEAQRLADEVETELTTA